MQHVRAIDLVEFLFKVVEPGDRPRAAGFIGA